MQSINQTISKGLEKKYFKAEELVFEKSKFVNIIETVLKPYEKMNEFFGLEGSLKAQAIYYGLMGGSVLVTVLLCNMVGGIF